jgi:hypothetical protein
MCGELGRERQFVVDALQRFSKLSRVRFEARVVSFGLEVIVQFQFTVYSQRTKI